MTPTYITVDGIQREVTSWPVVVDGITRQLDSKLAVVDGVQREIFGRYPDVLTKVKRVAGGYNETAWISSTTINQFFTIQNDAYYFAFSDLHELTSNNQGVPSQTAKTTLIAKKAGKIRLDYAYSTEPGCDQLTITVGGTTVVDGASGTGSGTVAYREINAGDAIVLSYSKDGSRDSGDDQCVISNFMFNHDVPETITYEYVNLGRFTPSKVGQSLESSGAQYIDTEFVPNQDTRVLCEVSGYPKTAYSTAAFGVRTSTTSGDAYVFMCAQDHACYRSDYGSGKQYFDSAVSYSGVLRIDKDRKVTTLNNEVSVTSADKTFTCPASLFLFACNTAGASSLRSNGLKMLSCKIYDDDVLVRDFVPYQDGQYVGMYDKVNSVLYTSLGTADFTMT